MTQYTLGIYEAIGHGRGFDEVAPIATPAVSTDVTYTVDGRYWERPVSLAFQLVTDGNAANRSVSVTIKDGEGRIVAKYVSATVQTASLTWTYLLDPIISSFNAVNGLTVTMPFWHGFLRPTWTITIATASKQAGDQLTAIVYDRARFDTGPGGFLQGSVEEVDSQRFIAWLRAQLIAS